MSCKCHDTAGSAPVVSSFTKTPAWIALQTVVATQPTVSGKLQMIYDAQNGATADMRMLATRLVLDDALAVQDDGQDPTCVLMLALGGWRDKAFLPLLSGKAWAGDTIQHQCPKSDGQDGTLYLADALDLLGNIDKEAAAIIANLAVGAAAVHDEDYSKLIAKGFATRFWYVIKMPFVLAGKVVAAAANAAGEAPLVWIGAGLLALYLANRMRKK